MAGARNRLGGNTVLLRELLGAFAAEHARCAERVDALLRDLRPATAAELDLCRAVRQEVFVAEQGVPSALEMDADDATSLHFLSRVHHETLLDVAACADRHRNLRPGSG